MSAPPPHLQVFQEPSGTWRWRYTEVGEDGAPVATLLSSHGVTSRQEAASQAQTAYPDALLADDGTSPQRSRRRRRRRRWRRVALVLALALLVRFRLRRGRWPWTRATAPVRAVPSDRTR